MTDQNGPFGVPPVPPAPGHQPTGAQPPYQPQEQPQPGGFLPPNQQPPQQQPLQYQPTMQLPQPGQPAFAGQPAQPPTGPRTSRRGLLIGLGAGALVLVLLIVAAVVTLTTLGGQHAPDRAVSSYLDSLVAGKASAAVKQLSPKPDGDLSLLADDVYSKADDRITRYEILKTSTSGKQASVQAKLTTASGSFTEDFALRSTGKDFIWDTWSVDGSRLDTITLDVIAPDGVGVAANGVELTGGSLRVLTTPMPAFPGTYVFEPAGQLDYVTTDTQTATVESFGTAGQAQTLSFTTTLTDAGAAASTAALDAFVDGCIAQHVYKPAGRCGYQIIGDSSVLTSINWTMRQRPTATFGPYDGTGFDVIPGTLGIFDMAGSGPRWTSSGTIDDYDLSGTITITADGVATFESNYQE